jgi:hypothetical protein
MTDSQQQKIRKLGELLAERQTSLEKTDTEITDALGLKEQAAYRLMKAGKMNIPLGMVKALADCLEVEREKLLRVVMDAQMPATFEVIESVLNPLQLTDSEKRLVVYCRKLSKGRESSPIVFDGGPVIALVAA